MHQVLSVNISKDVVLSDKNFIIFPVFNPVMRSQRCPPDVGIERCGHKAPSIPLVGIISASENNLRPQLSVEDLKKEDETLLFSSRLPELLVKPALPTYPHDRYFGKLPGRLPPMLVFGGTLDPKTPYDGSVSHIAALRHSGKIGLISVIGAPHFILWTAPDCFARFTSAFVQKAALADQACVMASAPLNSTIGAK
jgi:pimeloyl-ACP methyl ester carboxylesterase